MAEYGYDAVGKKLSVTYTTSKTNLMVPMGSIVPPQATNVAMTLKTDYCGNMIYENGKLRKILTDVGYITLNSGGELPLYHYFLQDHLGNNRVVVQEDGKVEQMNHYYAFGGLMGESSGDEVQPYKYNGKEFDRMHGLDWYDYGARMYDPVIGRWTAVDPLAEKYPNYSSHIYCIDNPIKSVDLFGTDIWNIDVGSGNVVQKINYIGKDIINLVYKVSEGLYETRISSITGEELFLELPFQAITQLSERETKVSDKNGDFYRINNGKCSSQIFEFLSENTAVEWMQIKTVHKNNAIDFITTSH